MDTPSISPAELTQYDPVITWMTYDLNERTIQEKKITKIIVDQWTVSLAVSLVPQVDHLGNQIDFETLEEWIQAIKEILPEKIKSRLPIPGTRQ